MTKATETQIPRLDDLDPKTMTEEQAKLAYMKLEYLAAHSFYWHVHDTIKFPTSEEKARAWRKVEALEKAVSEMGQQIGVYPWVGGLD